MRKIASLLPVLMLVCALAFGQTRTVSGTVRDDKGDPIPFATITVAGTNTATQADANGSFTLNNVADNARLTISSTGFANQTVSASSSLTGIILTRTQAQLQEVVVTALGVRRQPKELGYSTARISNTELTQARVTNVATGLAGKVSGLQINTTSSGVSPTTRVTLRGNRSILGNNQALLVVDDIPMPINVLNSLNPNDVDNVTVLKGASASALYGSAASNGVIIVTTRRGTRGKPQIRYSNTTTLESVSYLPKFQNEFGAYGGEGVGSAGTILFPDADPYVPYASYENQNYGPRFNGQMVPLGGPVRFFNPDGTFFDSTLMVPYTAKPDAKKKFFNRGVTVQNDLSYSAGDEKSRFYISAQDVTTTGVIPKDKNHRNAFRIAGSREVGRFNADYSLGYTLTHANTTPGTGVPAAVGPFAGQTQFGSIAGTQTLFGGATGGSYFQNRPVYWTVINTPANIDLRDFKDWQNNPFANPNGYYNAYYGNPWWQIDQTRLDERNNDLIGALNLNFRVADWLNLTVRGGLLHNDYNAKYTQAGFTFADWAIADPLGAGNIPSSVQKKDPQGGDVYSISNRMTGDFLASFNKDFGDFSVKVIGGSEVVDNRQTYDAMWATSLVIPDFYNISNRNGEPNVYQQTYHTRTIGVFGDATVGFKDYLFLHGTLRNDWVSTLSKENRSFLYPSVDASFAFSDAIQSLKGNRILSYGKLRAAYSKTAQVSIGPYNLSNTFNPATGFPYAVPGFTLNNSYSNPDIKPEFTTEKEVGIELGFLQNRIYFSAAFFNSMTTNQTIPIAISSTTGYSSAVINSGEMRNNGVELDLRFAPLLQTKSGFRWDIGANFSYIDNKVVAIAPGLNEVNVGGNSYAVVGKAYPQLRLSDWNKDSATGKVIVSATNGLPSPDPQLKNFGTTNPPLKFGVTTSLSFKGLTLSAVADYRTGAYIYNDIGQDLDFTGISWNSARYGRQNFVYPNSVYLDGSGKYVPNTNITVRNGNNEFWASTLPQVQAPYVTSAAFWKLRELALNYEFPRTLFNRVQAIKALTLGLVGRNLLMLRPKENIWTDPEFSTTNGNGIGTTDINQTPTTRTFGASLTVTF